MNLNLEKLSECKRKLTVIIPQQTAQKDYKSILRKYSKQVNIPGFRKGKAPLSMIENMIGEKLEPGFIDEFASKYYQQAITELKDVSPINQGQLEDYSWESQKELELNYVFEVGPNVELTKYKNFEIEFQPKKVTAEMIENRLKELQESYAKTFEKNSPIEKGDQIYYTLIKLNNKVYEKKKQHFCTIGDNYLGEQFNKDLIGKKKDNIVKSSIQVSSNNPEEEQGTKEIELKIRSVKKIELPKLDDEFAKDVGDFETLNELKKDIRNTFEKNIEQDNEVHIHSLIYRKIIEENPFEIPQSMVDKYFSEMLNRQENFKEIDKQKQKQLKAIYKQIAEMQIKRFFVIKKLREIEKVDIKEEEIENEIKANAEAMNMKIDEYKKLYKKQIIKDEINERIQDKKILKKIEKTIKIIKPKKTRIKLIKKN